MNSAGKLLILTLSFLMLTAFKKQNVNEWVYEREKKGIKVFTKKSKWGKMRDSKAVMVVASSPNEILKLLVDYNNYPSWVPRCKQAKILAHLNENEFIAHVVFNAPWPIADRDCVVRVKIERDKATGVIKIIQTSEPKYLKPQDGVVRIEQMVGIWKLTPVKGGTEVLNEYASNPGGNIPDWMTKTESVENPLATFENIQGLIPVGEARPTSK